jgi:hypothetical protein
LHLQAEGCRVLADDGGGEEVRYVVNVLVLECFIELIAGGGQGADAALPVLVVDEQF